MLDKINPQDIQDLDDARIAIAYLLNLVEELMLADRELKELVQLQRDEINRLKGEQGKPDIKASRKPDDTSSEKERKPRVLKPKRKREKRRKHEEVKINREEILPINRDELPADAEFKGYEDVIVQDVRIETDNIRFRKEKYYSPSTQQTYLAPLPEGYTGQFGPTVRALVPTLYYASGMSEPKIIELLEYIGLNISKGTIAHWLSHGSAAWEQEATEILQAGLGSTSWQHIDDTSTRVNGVNQVCHVLGNPYYTAYMTRPRKDRLTVIAVLQNRESPLYLFNEQTAEWLENFNVPKWAQSIIKTWYAPDWLDGTQVTQLLDGELDTRLNEQQLARIREAGALTAYYAQEQYPIVPILVSDDAPQFHHLTAEQMLCWVHEGRHYKKLMPAVPYHQEILDDIQSQFWDYYHELQAYRVEPDPQLATALEIKFDTIFGQTTAYEQLNRRLAQTMAHKEKLLVVLNHPELPLHNNAAELAVRQRVRKRDVSFGPRTDAGRRAWDIFMTIVDTAKKLEVDIFRYFLDRVSGKMVMPTLAELIVQKSPA